MVVDRVTKQMVEEWLGTASQIKEAIANQIHAISPLPRM